MFTIDVPNGCLKSIKSELHNFVTRIEYALKVEEYAFGIFVDISNLTVLHPRITRWIITMSKSRQFSNTVNVCKGFS